MIKKSSERVVIEGSIVERGGRAGLGTVRRRIEIDQDSGRIVEIDEPRGTGDLVLDNEHIVLPGIVDVHVHARQDPSGEDDYKETFRTASEAAVHGGVVAFAEMPNNPRPPIDDDSYRAKRSLTEDALCDILLYAGVGPSTRPLSFPVPYKVYMGPSIGDLFFHDEQELRDALARYAGQYVMFHAEDPEILRDSAGAASHHERRPPEAEVQAIDLVIRLAENYGFEAHVAHLTTAEGLRLIREARARGVKVTTEVTPHHLFYDQDNAGSFARPEYLQCNPPIRTRLDRIALLEGLRDGDIDFLATDHAPHTLEEKDRGISGVTHLDTVGPFLFWLLDEGLSLERCQEVCCEAPGRFISRYLPERYGRIEPGCLGSLTILRKAPITIRRADLRTKAGWSPFEGVTFGGRVSHTVVRGRIFPQDL